MSLIKWTLAMAGTAMGLRYMSGRQRRRVAADSTRAAQTGRDEGRDAALSSALAQGEKSSASAAGAGSGDWVTPAIDRVTGSSANRF